MKNPTRLMRVAYWIGAVFDASMLLPLLVPSVAQAMFGLTAFAPGADFRYATGVGAALMAGWTALLIWADRRPLERRGVLLLTVCPVVVGLAAAGAYAVSSGFIALPYLLPVFAIQLGLGSLYVVAYAKAEGFVRSTVAGRAR